LILDIFARRAGREGKLQVELAAPILDAATVGSSDALSRLGGIGTRGPSETKLETDRRRIRHRVSMILKEIGLASPAACPVEGTAPQGAVPTVALVGHTNAGKTTLPILDRDEAAASNALRHARSMVRRAASDRRELGLDTVDSSTAAVPAVAHSVRRLKRLGRRPCSRHDASNPERERQIAAGGGLSRSEPSRPMLDVFNKCDRLDDGERGGCGRFRPVHCACPPSPATAVTT
jgi:GTP-binding protein HflX